VTNSKNVIFLVLSFLVVGCQPSKPKIDPDSNSYRCYRELVRKTPGHISLHSELECSQSKTHYRQDISKNDQLFVEYVENGDQVKMSWRIEKYENGNPRLEERIFNFPLEQGRLFDNGKVVKLGKSARRRSVVRIMTKLDQQGRPVKIEKYQGADKEYVVIRKYQGDRLGSEATYDGHAKLKFRSVYQYVDNHIIEKMEDGQGRILMERKIEPSKP
jgi:hypothetical protein